MASSNFNRRFTDRACPTCGAAVGAPCRSLATGNAVSYPHKERRSPVAEAPKPAATPAPAPPPKPRKTPAPRVIAQQSWLSIVDRRGDDE